MAFPERQLSLGGIEMQFTTSHIGHFLFTDLIMIKITTAAKSNIKGTTQIVNVLSRGVVYSPVRFSDVNFDKTNESLPETEQPAYEALRQTVKPIEPTDTYNPPIAYRQSKTANVLFFLGLTSRLYEKYGISSFGNHPGAILTELICHLDPKEFEIMAKQFNSMFVTVN